MDHPLKAYWKYYGGIHAFINSWYLFAAILLTVACYPLWASASDTRWAEVSTSILPNLMGFSVAAIAIILAFSDAKALRALTQRGRADSYYVKTVSNLFHFLVVQTIALVLGIFGHAFHSIVLNFFGLFALFYALSTAIAASGQLLNTAIIINKAVWTPDSKPPGVDSGNQSRSNIERETQQ